MAKVKIVHRSPNPLPQYQTPDAAGMDLYANLEQPVSIKSLERVLIPTGIFIALPQDCEAQVRPRSGLALKHGVTVLNSPGTIDADYRGEVKVLLVNLSTDEFTINPGDRIAQMIIGKFERAEWELVDELDETQRGAGGYGHTGT